MSEENDAARAKRRVKKKNALKHGMYSREIMLPGENIRVYYALVAELMEEWAPEGPTERSLVQRLVELHWRRQRLRCYDQAKLQLLVEKIDVENAASHTSQELKDLGPEFNEAESPEEVNQILSEIDERLADYIEKKVPHDKSPGAAPWGPAIGKYLASLPSIKSFEGSAKVAALMNPDVIESDLARSDRIDEAIDRTIKRLMQVKTTKQIFPKMRNAKTEPKLINGSALAFASAQSNEKEQPVELPGMVEVFAKPNSVDP